MASIQNITVEDQGINYKVTFEWNNDQQTGDWELFEANFPADFNDIGENIESTMLQLAMAVARNQGVFN